MLKINRIKNQRIIGLLIFFFFAFAILPLAAQDKLDVNGKLTIKGSDTGAPRYGLVLKPQTNQPSGQAGMVYYKNPEDQFYYHDGTGWNILGSSGTTDRYVAGRIVSAHNSAGATRDGTNVCLGTGPPCNNPKADYTCDGTNDQEQINMGLNDLAARGGGAVYLLEGTYNISAQALPQPGEGITKGVVLHSNTALIGAGAGTVLKILSNTSNLNVINTLWGGSGDSGMLVSQLMIDGNSRTGSGNKGIYFYGIANSKIDKVWINDINGSAIYLEEGSSNNTITANTVQGSGVDSSNTGVIYIGGLLSGSYYNILSGNNVQNNTGSGIYVDASCGNTISYNNVQGNSGTYGRGICLVGADYINNIGNVVSGNNVQGNSAAGIYIYRNSTVFVDIGSLVTNNNVQGNSYGIYLYASAGSVISANQVQGNLYSGIYLDSYSETNSITGNGINNNGGTGAYDGIYLSGTSDNNSISYNHISDDQGSGYGINIASGSENNSLLGNYILDAGGYSGRLVQDLGSSGNIDRFTKYTDKLKLTLERVLFEIPTANNHALEASASPKAYYALKPALGAGSIINLNTTTAIADGKAVGDMLILEGASSLTDKIIVPNNANTILGVSTAGTCSCQPWPGICNCSCGGSYSNCRILCQGDVLTLIWNGSDWVEIGWAGNYP